MRTRATMINMIGASPYLVSFVNDNVKDDISVRKYIYRTTLSYDNGFAYEGWRAFKAGEVIFPVTIDAENSLVAIQWKTDRDMTANGFMKRMRAFECVNDVSFSKPANAKCPIVIIRFENKSDRHGKLFSSPV